jgi:hypothetical protein
MKKNLMAVLVLLLCAGTLPGQNPDLFKRTDQKGSAPIKDESFVISRQNVLASVQLLSERTPRLKVLLSDGKEIIIVNRRLERDNKKRIAWYGEVEKDPGSFVLLSVVGNVISGRINTSGGRHFRISYLGENIHQVAELITSKFPDDSKDFDFIDTDKPDKEADACPDPAVDIDIMVVYTATARAAAGGAAGMEALIYQCINLSNLTYQNSNVNQRLRLVHFAEVAYTESGNSMTDRDRLRNPSDGFMDNVHTLRNTFAADLVALIVENLENCGRAFIMTTVSAAQEPFGFCVMTRSCSADNLTFPHELGHNMGARHDCAADNTINSPFVFNHGFGVANPADGSGLSWRTVMATGATACGGVGPCNRVPFWSNPNINFSPTNAAATDPMGNNAGVCQANNAQTLNNTAATVANFRCSSPAINNVWMKDSWNDTGLEPDPNTAGDPMYLSPYIWIRNTQDAGLLQQHNHQNPEFGQQNFIYVKMHNGGVAASGNLELYIANASVSLSWPASWTLVASTPVNLAQSSTQVIEVPWNSVPGTGHYCMIARWVSAADPIGVETSDINANTRQNNNIVWRNLNIVDLSADDEVDVDVMVRGAEKNMATDLVFFDHAKFPKKTFFETGVVYVIVDKTIMEAWRKSGAKSKGIKVEGDRFIITENGATLYNLRLIAGKEYKVKIVFRRTASTISDKFTVEIRQYSTKRLNRILTGGVGYEIYTYKRESR